MPRALVVGWSVGVAVAIEAARRAPDRVAGLLVLGGAATGAFRVLPQLSPLPAQVPESVHRRAAQIGGWLLRVVGPPVAGLINLLPRSMDAGREALGRAGVDPAAPRPHRLRRADDHPGRGGAGVRPPRLDVVLAARARRGRAPDADDDLGSLRVPVTVVSGDLDTLAPPADMAALAAALPDARLVRLPGSHFLPLQFPDALAGELAALATRAQV